MKAKLNLCKACLSFNWQQAIHLHTNLWYCPRKKNDSANSSSFSCSKYLGASSSVGTGSAELSQLTIASPLSISCEEDPDKLSVSVLSLQQWNSSAEDALDFASECKKTRRKHEKRVSADQRLQKMTSKPKTNYRNSNPFHTAGSLEHKLIMADSENTTFPSSMFSLCEAQTSFHWPGQVQPHLISSKERVFVSNVTCNFDRSTTLSALRTQLLWRQSPKALLKGYRKYPIISPGLIFVQKAFLRGLFSGELTFGGAYYWKKCCVIGSIFLSEVWGAYYRILR